MAIFGSYYTANMLRIMKWPRRQGLFGKETYDGFIFDQTVQQMADWAAAIGAGHPKLATELLAYIYGESAWGTNDEPNIEMFARGTDEEAEAKNLDLGSTAPHDIVNPVQFSKHFPKGLPSTAFDNQTVREVLETTFMASLIYGLSHPKQFEAWYHSNLENFDKNRDTYNKIGLEIEELPSLAQNYINAKDIIDQYRVEMNVTFPKVHPSLLATVKRIRH